MELGYNGGDYSLYLYVKNIKIMAYEHKEGQGSLFKNDKQNDRQPDLKGTIMIGGKTYEIAAWNRTSQNGRQYISLQASLPRQNDVQRYDSAPRQNAAPRYDSAPGQYGRSSSAQTYAPTQASAPAYTQEPAPMPWQASQSCTPEPAPLPEEEDLPLADDSDLPF